MQFQQNFTNYNFTCDVLWHFLCCSLYFHYRCNSGSNALGWYHVTICNWKNHAVSFICELQRIVQNKDTDQLGDGAVGQKELLRGLQIPLETEGVHNIESEIWCNICGILKHIFSRRSWSWLLFSLLNPNTWQEATQERESLFGLVFWRHNPSWWEERAVGSVLVGPCDICLLPS